jgi:hypothetical protein
MPCLGEKTNIGSEGPGSLGLRQLFSTLSCGQYINCAGHDVLCSSYIISFLPRPPPSHYSASLPPSQRAAR